MVHKLYILYYTCTTCSLVHCLTIPYQTINLSTLIIGGNRIVFDCSTLIYFRYFLSHFTLFLLNTTSTTLLITMAKKKAQLPGQTKTAAPGKENAGNSTFTMENMMKMNRNDAKSRDLYYYLCCKVGILQLRARPRLPCPRRHPSPSSSRYIFTHC